MKRIFVKLLIIELVTSTAIGLSFLCMITGIFRSQTILLYLFIFDLVMKLVSGYFLLKAIKNDN